MKTFIGNYKLFFFLNIFIMSVLPISCDTECEFCTGEPAASNYERLHLLYVYPLETFQIENPNQQILIEYKMNWYAIPEPNPTVSLKIYKHTKGVGGCLAYEYTTTYFETGYKSKFVTPAVDFVNLECTPTEDYYYITLTSDDIPNVDCKGTSFVIGNPPLDVIDVELAPYKMLDVSDSYYEDVVESMYSSFDHPDPDPNPPVLDPVNVNIVLAPPVALNNFLFSAGNRERLAKDLENYTILHNNNDDTLRVYFVNDHLLERSLLGLSSWNKRVFDVERSTFLVSLNWSYIFEAPIEYAAFNNGKNAWSYFNQVTLHELLHQLAREGHDYLDEKHLGTDNERCALWMSTHFLQPERPEFEEYTEWWHFCTLHNWMLRTSLVENKTTNFVFPNSLKFPLKTIAGYNNEVKMSLQKTVYKETEPVIAKFELINKDTKPLEIYYLFDPEFTEANLKIEDNFGNFWTNNKMNLSPNMTRIDPTNVINPGDTLIISMPINNWGEYFSNDRCIDDGLTGIWGYFPANRKYKAMFDAEGFKSNTVEFEIIPLEENEEKILDAFDYIRNTGLPSNIQEETKGNSLNEYLMVANLWTKYWTIKWDDNGNYKNLVNDYLDFFTQYPESNYLYNDRFMSPFLIKLFYNKNNYKSIIDNLQGENVTTQMKTYFENRDINSRISNILNYYKIVNKK